MKPVLAIVGRPNVGKSELFNRLSRKKIALVYDRAGVTRDRMVTDVRWNGFDFQLIDTGGIGLDDESGFEESIQREVSIALDTASDILFVVDGRAGIQHLDEEVSRRLRKAKKRVWLVVNKLDSKVQEGWEAEFLRLGFEEAFSVSAAHGLGVDALMKAVSAEWSQGSELPEEEKTSNSKRALRVALVGRPNVGKSSLINALIEEDRLIVSPVAGTTRDAVDVQFRYGKQDYCFVDTAGMRKKTRIRDSLEAAMTSRTAHSIQRADICVLVVDSVEGVGVQDKKIAGLIQDAQKPCILLINKWDLAMEARKRAEVGDPLKDKTLKEIREEYEEAVRSQLFFFPFVPVLFVSAEKRSNLTGWLKMLETVEAGRVTDLSAGPLNRLIHQAQERHPPRTTNRRKTLKIFYVSQLKDETARPTLAAFVNDPKLWYDSYQRYLEAQIRKKYLLTGCPIRWVIKGRRRIDA